MIERDRFAIVDIFGESIKCAAEWLPVLHAAFFNEFGQALYACPTVADSCWFYADADTSVERAERMAGFIAGFVTAKEAT